VIAARFSDPGQPFHSFAKRGPARWTGKVELIEERLTLPLRWRKPARIFVNSTFDLFHEALPDEAIDRVFAVMALCPQHVFQILTKRPERMRQYVADPATPRRVYDLVCDLAVVGELNVVLIADPSHEPVAPPGRRVLLGLWPLPNCWKGVSVEDQPRADERIPVLLETSAAVRWISAEPLLGPLQLYALCDGHKFIDALKGTWWHDAPQGYRSAVSHGHEKLDWVIIGGESGPNARPFDLDWARPLLAGCRAAGVACFVKQLGSATGYNLHDRKGGDPAEWPADLRVREFPDMPQGRQPHHRRRETCP
jgi:protein gp37